MTNPLPDLSKHLSCALQRADILDVPSGDDTMLLSLLAVEVPEEFHAVHCPWHFVSFASHVQRIAAEPFEYAAVGARPHRRGGPR